MMKTMKVLWTTDIMLPEFCKELGIDAPVHGGWMPSLAQAVRTFAPEIELHIVCQGPMVAEKVVDGIHYYSLGPARSSHALVRAFRSVEPEFKSRLQRIVKSVEPDVVHIHGSEGIFPPLPRDLWGDRPTIISLQGIISGCSPHYMGNLSENELAPHRNRIREILQGYSIPKGEKYWRLSRGPKEAEAIRNVDVILGRTEWDRAWTRFINPKAKYMEVGEILRDPFYRGRRDASKVVPHSIYCGAVRHKCYRGSLLATLPLAINIAIWRRVWKRCVTKFICLTPFAKAMMIKAGLPEDKIVVKGNSIEDVSSRYKRTRDDGKLRFLYAGRMSDEKGPQVLIETWNKMGEDAPELLMIGDGDERGRYEAMVKSRKIKFVGQKTREEVLQAVVDADIVVVPSLCYEGLPTNILEAFMLGRPCLVSNLGALPSIVKDGVSGWTFKAVDAEDLIRVIQSVSREELDKRGIAARVEYEKHYTVSANFLAAEKVYRNVKGEC